MSRLLLKILNYPLNMISTNSCIFIKLDTHKHYFVDTKESILMSVLSS